MKRKRWIISYVKTLEKWQAKSANEADREYRTQREAVNEISALCRDRWQNHGEISELMIKAKTGQIRDNRTYGKDPVGGG